jgi:DNA processing protein
MAAKNHSNKFFSKDISTDRSEILATLRLIRSDNIGPVTFLKLIKRFGRPSAALREAENILAAKGKSLITLRDAEQEIKDTEKHGARIITIFDEHYPALLSEIDSPPIVISVLGNIEKLNERTVALVGARYSSANAVSLSYKFGAALADENCVIVSGLARGIDTAAHKGALAAKNNEMPTIAVLAGGIDNIYPPENEKLYKEIAGKGLVISENSFGTVPKAEHFPRRNRIISGLSQITCVVEAALKSGSLITARFAIEQNREVACVPGFPLDPRSEGTNLLIKKGASLVTSSKDILELLNNYETRELKHITFNENDDDVFYDERQGKQIDIDLLSIISTSPTSVDDIINLHGFSAAEINSKLLEHEIAGEIIRHPGNKVSKAA